MGDGFQTATLPTIAGVMTRLPAMAVKLNGDTASTKPSSGRYSVRFHTVGELRGGWMPYMSSTYLTPKRRKSQISTPASISACHTFLPWPTMVAARSL